MKLFTKKMGMVAVATLLSIATFNVFAGCPYRTYYLDSSCHYYYIDANGMAVKGGKYNDWRYKGFPVHRDCCGRLYQVDAWGTKMYLSKRCHSMECSK